MNQKKKSKQSLFTDNEPAIIINGNHVNNENDDESNNGQS